ncbi:MAG TPA: hypothetical protein VK524_00945 [Polyangiaceae bacterium]|nr:hypothetical protein [Polyangiaceae bacterium]
MSIQNSFFQTRSILFSLLAFGVAQACGSSSEGDEPRRRGDAGHDASSFGGNAGAGGSGADGSIEDAASSDAAEASLADARSDADAAREAGLPRPDAGRDAASDARSDAPAPLPECEIISCGGAASNHACCGDIFSFGLDAEDHPLASLVTSFTALPAAATADFAFTAAGQDGAIGVRLNPPRMPALVDLTSTWSGPASQRPYMTLESGGTAGCGYAFKANFEADLANPLFCWGGSFTPETLTIRIESTGAGNARLIVTDVDVR